MFKKNKHHIQPPLIGEVYQLSNNNSHGWNPLNLAGMLNLYSRGGPSGGLRCHSGRRFAREVKTSSDRTHDALEELRRDMGLPSPTAGSWLPVQIFNVVFDPFNPTGILHS